MNGNAACLTPLLELVSRPEYEVDVLLVAEGPLLDEQAALFDLVARLGRAWRRLELPADPTATSRARPSQRPNAPLAFYTRSALPALVNDRDIPPEPLPETPASPAGPPSSNLLVLRLDVGQRRVLLVGVHLPSKLHGNTAASQAVFAATCQQAIAVQESLNNTLQTFVLGDFNMSPYEPGLLDRDRGFHSVSSQHIAHDRNITPYDGRTRRYYYNPMWAMQGDYVPHSNTARPPGTYYRSPKSIDEPYWQCLDGLLVSPEALPNFERASLQVLSASASCVLYDGQILKSAYSDHLPVFFTLTI